MAVIIEKQTGYIDYQSHRADGEVWRDGWVSVPKHLEQVVLINAPNYDLEWDGDVLVSVTPKPHQVKVDETPSKEFLAQENKILKAQLQAQTERSDFIEDCIAEMATVVYGGV